MKHLVILLATLMPYLGITADTIRVNTRYGTVEGQSLSGVNIFKGIPFAAPPTGDNRWREPQPLQPWDSVLVCTDYRPDPMQEPIYGDMNFGAGSMSEDCLYLNVWAPATPGDTLLPVLIYFNGGGLMAGSGSEPRYAGLSMARRGIVSITANYREGIFGFYAHPQLSAETPHKGSGNYGFYDQLAAIRWLKENIRQFGGDPARITIAGESAGAFSVSMLVASPLSKDLFAQAIVSSGSVVSDKRCTTLAEAEAEGIDIMKQCRCRDISEMRALPADTLMRRAQIRNLPKYCIDNRLITEQPLTTYSEGRQQHVPLLIGGNSLESNPANVFGEKLQRNEDITLDDIRHAAQYMFGRHTDEMLGLYGIDTPEDIFRQPGIDLCNDLFLAYATWRMGDIHRRTSGQPVWRYLFARPRPRMIVQGKMAGLAGGLIDCDGEQQPESALPKIDGAVHSADIEYAMGNLATNRVYDWQPEDWLVSDIFQTYYANFIITGNPNGIALPYWPETNNQDTPPVMRIDTDTRVTYNPAEERRYRRMNEIFR